MDEILVIAQKQEELVNQLDLSLIDEEAHRPEKVQSTRRGTSYKIISGLHELAGNNSGSDAKSSLNNSRNTQQPQTHSPLAKEDGGYQR